MIKPITRTALSMALVCALASPSVIGAEKPAKATAQTKLDLYLTATEAWQMMQEQQDAILVDVRDPVEIKFTGFATPTQIHVPWMVADSNGWSAKRSSWAMVKNPDFEAQLSNRLAALKAKPGTPIIVMCRSGSTRSAPAVNLLADQGYTNVWTVVDGFEGGKLKQGDSKGVRAQNGWRNSGLPWSYKIDQAVAWQPNS
ncbi:rhodanese-like domain-containing protein [Motiliproteus coralliicola]|nr:rhodanese-like domain-containing protein [Motiliproteus coralliicola]